MRPTQRDNVQRVAPPRGCLVCWPWAFGVVVVMWWCLFCDVLAAAPGFGGCYFCVCQCRRVQGCTWPGWQPAPWQPSMATIDPRCINSHRT